MTADLRQPGTLADVLLHNVDAYPDREAVTDGTRRVSWRELFDAARHAAAQFEAFGLSKGDRVAVVLNNQIEAVILYWACALSGVIFVGANPRLGHDDLQFILHHSGARLIFVAETAGEFALIDAIHQMRLPDMRDAFVANDAPGGFFARTSDSSFPSVSISPDDVFAICYTSGTTGAAKGALLAHRNLVWCAGATSDLLSATPDDSLLLTVGITHIFGLSAGVLVAAISGARLVLLPSYGAADALDLCERENVTIHHGTPTMFVLEIAAQRRAPRDLHALRTGIVAAAPVEPELVDEIREELQCDIRIAWGLTETSPTVTMVRADDPEDAKRSSVGRPLPGVEIRIDSPGAEHGEILVKSPGVFGGYYKDTARTSEVLTHDGWFRSGDVGHVDDEGYLHLVGRQKEIIIRGGLHVYPDEVESILRTLPWIKGVALVGVPDRVLGERSCACIMVDDAYNPPENLLDGVRAAVAGRLADYKVPDAVMRVDEMPRTPSGKILKRLLRQDAVAQNASG
jgi:acyl-CoA synthetase (AMP-forming)/AMP-acid ligase II